MYCTSAQALVSKKKVFARYVPTTKWWLLTRLVAHGSHGSHSCSLVLMFSCSFSFVLQGKSGHETSQYQLPASVLATGIDKVREAIQDEEDEKTTKQRQREKTRPKMGKVNVSETRAIVRPLRSAQMYPNVPKCTQMY